MSQNVLVSSSQARYHYLWFCSSRRFPVQNSAHKLHSLAELIKWYWTDYEYIPKINDIIPFLNLLMHRATVFTFFLARQIRVVSVCRSIHSSVTWCATVRFLNGGQCIPANVTRSEDAALLPSFSILGVFRESMHNVAYISFESKNWVHYCRGLSQMPLTKLLDFSNMYFT